MEGRFAAEARLKWALFPSIVPIRHLIGKQENDKETEPRTH